MIRPNMKDQSTQTTLAADDPRLGRDVAARWAEKAGYDMEPAQTVRAEIYAQVKNHIRLMPGTAQEPVLVLNGISEVGVRRFFWGWPVGRDEGCVSASLWTCASPQQLHTLLRLETVSRLALGPCRLHVRGSEAHGHRLLMCLPPFKAWFNRSKTGRTELRIEFKIVVFQDTTDLTPPPACSYDHATLMHTERYAMSVLHAMSRLKLPLSPAFFRMLGQEARAVQAEEHAVSRSARLSRRRRDRAFAKAEMSEDWSPSEEEG